MGVYSNKYGTLILAEVSANNTKKNQCHLPCV